MKSSPPGRVKICLAQINTTVGDFAGNRRKIAAALLQASRLGCGAVIFPEMTVTGYPPEDLLFKKSFIDENTRVLKSLAPATKGLFAVVGFADCDAKTGALYNAAAVFLDGKLAHVYRKNKLPNYGVFDEKRYFSEGKKPLIFKALGLRWGISICEDIWDRQSFVYRKEYSRKVDCLINISASPYHCEKMKERKLLLKELTQATKSWVIYLNLVGGQDELVFDGGSLVADPNGNVFAQAAQFSEELKVVEPDFLTRKKTATPKSRPLVLEEEIYSALTLGTRDYFVKNGFKKAVIGLSGGIDSALVAALASDALGPENVIGVTMPSPYNSPETYRDSKAVAANLKIRCLEFRIDSLFAEYKKVLQSVFAGLEENSAEENLQARIRGTLLMALSNKFGYLVLTTGNKSEIAAGYCTLYGDMAGGFAVIKDVPKTMVFRLAKWRNRKGPGEVIPASVIERAPSAELRHNQTDQDSLPPYEVLDRLIDVYVDKDHSLEKAMGKDLSPAEAQRIARMIERSEYKRRQAPPGIKITPRAFGRDRRMPITNHFLPGEMKS